ncbi:NERD domain-containing protein [Bacillus sp. JJ1127]|uniref:NERD domain-containing protein n=1 Tax=Bacillus sp. JJ1127 TaxID=3122952 RepID=UPI002FFDC82E
MVMYMFTMFLFAFLIAGVMMYRAANHSNIKGRAGEKEVRKHLSKLDSNKYLFMHDITLRTEQGKTTQIDHIVIAQSGIFVIETKNYKGWIFGNEWDSKWTQVNFKRKDKFHNPVWQNYGHIKTIQYVLNNEDIPFISLITFSNSSDLKKINITSSHVYAIYFSEVVAHIRNHTEQILSPGQMKKIYRTLQQANITDKNIKKQHVENIRTNKQEANLKVQKHICPRCNGNLVQRKGSKGVFLSCSNFPSCRYTAQLSVGKRKVD